MAWPWWPERIAIVNADEIPSGRRRIVDSIGNSEVRGLSSRHCRGGMDAGQ
jgi:hypothetical protein